MNCGPASLDIPASPPETGTITVSEDGQQIIGEGLEDAQGVPITLNADPNITGRFTGSFSGVQEGVPVTINYFWQVVTEEYIVGFLTTSFSSEGVTCNLYRPYELVYIG
jgi:hypothetical protein